MEFIKKIDYIAGQEELMRERTRRYFGAEEKLKIIRLVLLEKQAVSAKCEEYKLSPSLYYLWQKQSPLSSARGVHRVHGESMTEAAIERVLERAREAFPGVKPRVISDNGPQLVSRYLKDCIRVTGMSHVRTSPRIAPGSRSATGSSSAGTSQRRLDSFADQSLSDPYLKLWGCHPPGPERSAGGA